ncbi:MAG: RecQ family ATP-dependent DNA helicase [Luteitalea sp.]|nr:RecQ family ATP-dependent DNA helicase [Luteitalea sp.]
MAQDRMVVTPMTAVAPWAMVDLLSTLQQCFGHTSFRAGQEDLVRSVLDGHDVLAVMPTGSGKSLGFQLPALVLPGTTLVVSPLISLMKDQVDELNGRGIRAAALHSMLPSDAKHEALTAARQGDLRLLYVAPERFASDYFARLLRDLPIARFVVDEAHCVSDWGHDFRPDYRRLRTAAAECRRSDGQTGRPPLAAFTATATPEVRDDIVDLLGLVNPRVLVSGFDRPNIHLQIRPVSGDLEKLRLLPQLVAGRRSLVYAATRRSAEEAAETLRETGLQAGAYHAGLRDAERSRVQDAFASGALRVVCATNAFGMGIDRPDVEAVIHVAIPGSLEAYYQEIGRAGRDGRQATATLLWNYRDVKTRQYLIDHGREELPGRAVAPLDPAEVARRKELDHKKLRRMAAYANAAGCLRATILRYFGDPAAREPCEACGNCDRRAPLDAAARLRVRKILSGIARAGERYGRRKVAAMLVGHVEDLPEPLTRLSTTGLLREEDPQSVEQWIDATCAAGLVRTSADKYQTLSLTPLGREVMAGRVEDVAMAVPVARRRRVRRRTSPFRGAFYAFARRRG